MTTSPNIADHIAHAHLQMKSRASLKVFDLLRGPKASVADPAGISRVVTFSTTRRGSQELLQQQGWLQLVRSQRR